MFRSARLKITLWYVLIIMAVSVFFSMAFYQVQTRELQRIIDRVSFEKLLDDFSMRPPPPRFRNLPSLEELQNLKRRSEIKLIMINGVILLFALVAGYLLAGKTLAPILKMVEEQDKFISNASHELRTPIATMRAEMEASLLQPILSADQARSLIKSNLQELDTLQNMTNKLLKLTQVESQQLVSQQISINDHIEKIVEKMRKIAKRKGIVISTNLVESKLLIDPIHLSEILFILLDNAIKYSPQHSTIRVVSILSAGKIAIKVIDQGIGISAKDLPFIFERFYRADSIRATYNGSGLGLSIAKTLVEKYQGRLSCISRLDRGSEFVIEFNIN